MRHMVVVTQHCDVTGVCSTIGTQDTLHIVVVPCYGMRDCRSTTAGTDTGLMQQAFGQLIDGIQTGSS